MEIASTRERLGKAIQAAIICGTYQPLDTSDPKRMNDWVRKMRVKLHAIYDLEKEVPKEDGEPLHQPGPQEVMHREIIEKMEGVVKDWESSREQDLLEKIRTGSLPSTGKRKKGHGLGDERNVRQRVAINENERDMLLAEMKKMEEEIASLKESQRKFQEEFKNEVKLEVCRLMKGFASTLS